MSEYTPTTDQVRQIYTQMCELAACVGERPFGGAGSFDRWRAEHDREVAAKAWEEGFEEPRECCGLCPSNSCPWDNGNDGPSNPYEKK